MSLETIVKNMVAANEPEANIAKVIKQFNSPLAKVGFEETNTEVETEEVDCGDPNLTYDESQGKCVPIEEEFKPTLDINTVDMSSDNLIGTPTQPPRTTTESDETFEIKEEELNKKDEEKKTFQQADWEKQNEIFTKYGVGTVMPDGTFTPSDPTMESVQWNARAKKASDELNTYNQTQLEKDVVNNADTFTKSLLTDIGVAYGDSDSDFAKGVSRGALRLAQSQDGMKFIRAAKAMKNFNDRIKNENLSDEDEIEFGGYLDANKRTYYGPTGQEYEMEPGMLDKFFNPTQKGTVGEARKYYNENFIKPLVSSKKYQDLLEKMGNVQLLDGQGNITDEAQQVIGEQTPQMAAALTTFGLSTLYQEATNSAIEAVDKKLQTEEGSGLYEGKYKDLTNDQKNQLAAELYANGEIDLEPILENSAKAAGLDLVSNYFVVGKATKFMPKKFFRDLFSKNAFKALYKQSKPIVGGVIGEEFAELTQEGLGKSAIARALGASDSDIVEAGDGLLSVLGDAGSGLSQIIKEDPKQLLEVIAQTAVGTGGIVQTGQAASTAVNVAKDVMADVAAASDPNAVRSIKNKGYQKVEQAWGEGKITRLEMNERKDILDAAEEFNNNTKLKNLKGAARKRAFNETVNEIKANRSIANNNNNIESLTERIEVLDNNELNNSLKLDLEVQKDKLTKENSKLQNKKNKATKNIIKEVALDVMDTQGKGLATWINEQKEGVFADKFVKIFGTTKAAENFITKQFGENALNDPEVQSLLAGKVGSNNGIKLGEGAIIVKDNIKTNYDATGDTSGANSVHHEVMHFILDNSTAKELNTLRKDMIGDLNNIKDPKFKSAVEFAIERQKDYKNTYKGKGRNKKLAEEFFTSLSDGMRMLDLKNLSLEDGSILQSIGDKIKGLLGQNTNNLFDFNNMTAANTFQFLKNYNNFGKKDQSINIQTPKTGTDIKDDKTVASKPVKQKLFQAIQSLVPESINTKEDYQKFLSNPRQFNPLYNSITQQDGAINNYIKGIATSPEEFQLMVENVQDRVLAFNPEAERKDGGAVGIDAFVERIMSDTRFGKLDARKKLFEEGEKTKVQDKIDKPEARQIKAEEKIEPQRQVNLVLPKEIKDAAEVSIEPAILAGEKAIEDLPANATIKQRQRKVNQAVNKIVKNRIDTAIKKGLLNKKNFPNFIDKNWEAIGNAYLNNTDITQLKKPNQLETKDILQDWIDNGFTKEDVTEFFNDPSLSPQARSDRKNVGLVRALNTEIVNEAKIELAKKDPKTAADFKAKTGFALASKPLNKKTLDYLNNNSNVPQTLEYNNVKQLLKANGLSMPVLNTPEDIKTFFTSAEPLILQLPKKIAKKSTLLNPSNRSLFGAAYKKREGKPGATKESIKKYKDLVNTWETEQKKLNKKIENNPNAPEFFGAAGNGASVDYTKTWGKTVNEIKANTAKGQAANIKNAAIHEQVTVAIFNAVKNDPKKYLPIAAQIYKASGATAANWHRLGAEMVAYSKDLSSGVTYEHAMPAKSAYLALLDSAVKGVPFDIAYPAVMKNYKVIALAKVDDDKLAGEYKSGMGFGWNFYKDNWLQRYFNPTVAAIDGGIDPNSIVYFNGQTVQDIFKVNPNGLENKALASKPVQKSTLDTEFNKMLERTKGIKAEAVYSEARAIKLGATKGWQAFVPYSNEDYMGLVYPTLGKGKQGDADLKWWTDNVMDPYNQGIQNYETAKEAAMQEWKQLKKKLVENLPVVDKVTGILKKKAVRGFTNEEAVRVYIWDNQNMTPDNLAKKDIKEIKKYINKNPKLKAFANQLQTLIPDGYPQPTPGWLVGNISTDLINEINTVTRKEYLKPWREAIDLIYTKDNVNKLRATFGDKYVEALDDVLYRMDTGRNRPTGANRVTNLWLNWLNNSVGTTMFFNQRSALLQTISSINFLNWTDNNPIMAAKAFGNQKQYWKDFATLFNSDFLKQRRSGLKTDVSADEIAATAATSNNKARAALNEILKAGFIGTQIADSFAIASGGATFYRNRINKYKKEGLSQKEAEEKAFFDFRNIAIESQQSSDPSRISMQQASQLGRIILSYANTPVQYARLIKKAASDLKNGRGDAKTNVSKILYYGAIQNIIFTALQSALFGIMFDEEDEEVGDKEAQFKQERKEGAPLKIVNGIVDTMLRGSGVGGAFVAMLKNILLEIDRQRKKTRPDFTYAANKIFSFSPVTDTKFRKALSAARKFTYKQELQKMYDRGVAIDNPALLAAGELASAFVNIPADRVVKKLNNLKTATEEETKAWQSAALVWGYGEWELGIQARKTDEDRAKAKKEKAKKKELKKDLKKLQKKVDKETKSPVKDKAGRILGRANKDGSIEVAPGLSPEKKAEVIRHEKLHQKEMQNGSNAFTGGGKLDYNNDFVFYGKKKYPRKNGKIKDGTKWKHEGDHSLPWEVFAHKHD